jgi:hypothetical protein
MQLHALGRPWRLSLRLGWSQPVFRRPTSKQIAQSGGEAVVRKVYGHLGQVRYRAEAVEYRVEQHATKLGARLEALRGAGFGITIGTTV